jgi:hypothetical protein
MMRIRNAHIAGLILGSILGVVAGLLALWMFR